MKATIKSQPREAKITHFFEIGPRIQSLTFSSLAAHQTLATFTKRLKEKVGGKCRLSAFPQRIYTQNSWKVHITGELGELHLLLNISGRTQLPDLDSHWAARLNIELSDHVDACWFVKYLMWSLKAEWAVPEILDSVFKEGISYDN